MALRRLPGTLAEIEAEFERLRHQAGMIVDSTLLRPPEEYLAEAHLTKLRASLPSVSPMTPAELPAETLSAVY